MTCQNCVKAVEKSLSGQTGIEDVNIDLENERVIVQTTLPTSHVKQLIESSGRRAVLQGLGSVQGAGQQGAAVAMITEGAVQGVARMVQFDQDKCIIEGTLDGLLPGQHGLRIHELGDISQGCFSCGDVLEFGNAAGIRKKTGDLGSISADDKGRAEFRMEVDDLALADVIGRSMVVHDWTQHPPGSDSRLACGIIARSSGLFQNSKRICACDGVTLWDERDRPIAGPGRRQPKTDSQTMAAAHL